jgi:hypothetical protein
MTYLVPYLPVTPTFFVRFVIFGIVAMSERRFVIDCRRFLLVDLQVLCLARSSPNRA